MQRSKIKVEIKRLSHGEDLSLPCYATTQSAGMDLYAALNDSAVLNPLERLLVPTGIVIAIPNGFEGQIRPRSGLAAKHGITVLNSPGTIDSDYRGEVKICLINLSNQPYEIKRGDRIAQILISPVSQVIWDDREELCAEETGRNAGGFGSSGRQLTKKLDYDSSLNETKWSKTLGLDKDGAKEVNTYLGSVIAKQVAQEKRLDS